MTDRDYVAEMDERIATATEGSGWVAAVVAAKLQAELAETDPDLLDGWLHALAVQMLRRVIGLRMARERAVARSRARSRDFAVTASDFSGAEDDEAREVARVTLIGMFHAPYVVDEENKQKRAADMTGPDHLFVAEHTYQRTADEALMEAAFHRAVAKKVGKKRTADVFTEEQYERLYRSITRQQEEAVT